MKDYISNNSHTNPIREHRLHIKPDGTIWKNHESISGTICVETKKKYPEVYNACRQFEDFGNVFHISEFGHILPGKSGDKIAVGRLKKPLQWQDGYNDEDYDVGFQVKESIRYDGLIYGIGYTLRYGPKITFNRKYSSLGNKEFALAISKVAQLAERESGTFYIKDNGVLFGIFGHTEFPVYIGRIQPTDTNNHTWQGWFINQHDDVPYLD